MLKSTPLIVDLIKEDVWRSRIRIWGLWCSSWLLRTDL